MSDISGLLAPILNNQVVTGLSFTALLGGAAYQLYRIPSAFRFAFRRLAITSISVRSDEAAFEWIDRWISAQPYAEKTRMMKVRTYVDFDEVDHGPRRYVPRVMMPSTWTISPAQGLHWFWWRGKLLWLNRADTGQTPSQMGYPLESITITTMGRSQKTLRDLLAEAEAMKGEDENVALYLRQEGRWSRALSKSQRPVDSVILQHGQGERIVADAVSFLERRDFYVERGIPWRRGYLFSGPPGTGKTSFILALASALHRPVYLISLNDVLTDGALLSSVLDVSRDAVVAIEDIDCIKASKGEEAEKQGVTRAGLLNVLDGLATPDGRIFVMTTNFPEKLDAALLRPGRVDLREEFGELAGADQERMARRYYDAQFLPVPFPVAPAVLQGVFMDYPDDPQGAREALLKAHHPDIREAA